MNLYSGKKSEHDLKLFIRFALAKALSTSAWSCCRTTQYHTVYVYYSRKIKQSSQKMHLKSNCADNIITEITQK